MSIIADYEDFPQPDSAASIPNYSAIYGYLGNLMAGKESPTLSSLGKVFDLNIFIQEILSNILYSNKDTY